MVLSDLDDAMCVEASVAVRVTLRVFVSSDGRLGHVLFFEFGL
jgi:hypothetical protein